MTKETDNKKTVATSDNKDTQQQINLKKMNVKV